MTETAAAPAAPCCAEASVALPWPEARLALQDTGRAFGAQIEDAEGRLRLGFSAGALELRQARDGAALTLSAPDPAGLQLLRDALAERAEETGLPVVWARINAPSARPGNISLAQVTGAWRLSPSYFRVEIEGPDLARFDRGGWHFRLLFGPEGAGWPGIDARGVTTWPGGVKAWRRPVYTIRWIEPAGAAARIGFDVFDHAGGHVRDWAEGLRGGERIAISGPGGGRGPKPAAWTGIVADETAMPVAARILEALPRDAAGEAVIFVPDSGDAQPIDHPPCVRLRWALRGGGEAPLDALRALTPPAADRAVFFAAEKDEAAAARAHLAGIGFGRGESIAGAYWSRDG